MTAVACVKHNTGVEAGEMKGESRKRPARSKEHACRMTFEGWNFRKETM